MREYCPPPTTVAGLGAVASWQARCGAAARRNYCAGMVINGRFSLPPVSPSVKKNMMAVSARFVFQSPSSIQNQ